MVVTILTPDAHIYEGQADAVTLPGTDGSLQVLDNHAPLIAILQRGVISVKQRGEEKRFQTTGGVAEILRNRVSVLAEGIINT